LGEIPWAPPPADLARARIALVTTGALHLKGDVPFRVFEEKWGDTGFRFVPHAAAREELDLEAPYVDEKYATRDPEVALPRRALDALVAEGTVGAAAPRHASFAGGVVRPFPGLAESAAAVHAAFREDGVGAAVILPTCSLCVQNICVIARELEARGIPTVCVSFLPELTEIVGAPRCLTVHFPFGAPCGNPDNPELHRAVLRDALGVLLDAKGPGTIAPSSHAWREA
jgi:D-proline reductase (dithiol) PrdB